MSELNAAPQRVLVTTHPFREDVGELAESIAHTLRANKVAVRIVPGTMANLCDPGIIEVSDSHSTGKADMVIALGGDGTVLRSASLSGEAGLPLLGINLGKVGFLAEAETGELPTVLDRLLRGDFAVEERTTLSVHARDGKGGVWTSWAFNDIAVEKAEPARMLEVYVEVDGTRVSRYGCDGVLCSTPTGSTAHAMSAGGPVMWPNVDALLLVPVNAHALFTKPLVTHPSAKITIGVESSLTPAALIADGKPMATLPAGSTVDITSSDRPVHLVRMSNRSYPQRLVSKLAIPVEGWRNNR
ncbi:NAD kinase [Haloglycomyces albus]|uniref:NAD kinase n=1 Tax=Haloglycomyces albus TaxID=526067 RepID=UPI00046D5242|nr:NAD kinase [Haloglycomyces albus]